MWQPGRTCSVRLVPYEISPPATVSSRNGYTTGSRCAAARATNRFRSKEPSGRTILIAASVCTFTAAAKTPARSSALRSAGPGRNWMPSDLAALYIGHLESCVRIVRIDNYGDARQSRHDFLKNGRSRFPASSAVIFVMPVTLPPGRARLETSPAPTGSAMLTMTIGISVVAALAAAAAGVDCTNRTFGWRRTNSSASEGSLSNFPSAKRYSSATFFQPHNPARSIRIQRQRTDIGSIRGCRRQVCRREGQSTLSAHRRNPATGRSAPCQVRSAFFADCSFNDLVGAHDKGLWNLDPSARAARMLITSSNLVGCSTGISDGFEPRNSLATRTAARPYCSMMLAEYDISPPSAGNSGYV